jgi:triacylglycerol lipase
MENALGGLVLTISILAFAAGAAQATPAVVLVSGFDTTTPFSTSAPSCAGQEGETWSPATGVAASLKQAGYTVFTAPTLQSETSPPAPCLGTGQTAPPAAATIDTNGDIDANGRALIALFQFLASNYGVTSVQLVGHSDGGLWSRSAIGQMDANATDPLTVQSLTTMGTPHTGSFGADLAVTLNGGTCDLSNEIEQLLCEGMLDVIQAEFGDLGPATIEQLTSSFLQGWNEKQAIGCPVRVLGGTYVDVPLPGYRYYDPNDGIVGIASAHAAAATSILGQPIPAPGFQATGRASFPVVHSSVLSFLSANDLLNQAGISATVLDYVRTGATTSACVVAGAPSSPTTAEQPASPRVGFHSLEAPRGGKLSRPAAGQVVVLGRGASLRCKGRAIAATPLLGSRRARVAFPRCKRKLRVEGRRALALRPARGRALRASHDGTRLRVSVKGPALRGLRVQARVGKRWRTAKARGATRLKVARGRVTVRATGRARNGRRLTAVMHVNARAR